MKTNVSENFQMKDRKVDQSILDKLIQHIVSTFTVL